MQDVFSQIAKLFYKLNGWQKGGVWVSVGLLAFVIWSYYPTYIPVCSVNQESNDMRKHLDELTVPYKERAGKIWVQKKHISKVYLASANPCERGHGFELFDANTWIKGEKELQILEMRALKGQLERELLAFEYIKHASVILDLASPRAFGSPSEVTKASVILTLQPQVRLGCSQLQAITHHLTGAVRGLSPQRVAISDTKGRLYQAITLPEATDPALMVQLEMQDYIERMMEKVCGIDNACITYYMGRPMVVDVLVNQTNIPEDLQLEVIKKIEHTGERYGHPIKVFLEAMPFTCSLPPDSNGLTHGSMGMMVYFFMVGCALVALSPMLRSMKKKKKTGQENTAIGVDISVLASSLKGEDPKTLALMFSYLEPKRAEEILAVFPKEIQDAILVELEQAP